jgi:hypothetical protein
LASRGSCTRGSDLAIFSSFLYHPTVPPLSFYFRTYSSQHLLHPYGSKVRLICGGPTTASLASLTSVFRVCTAFTYPFHAQYLLLSSHLSGPPSCLSHSSLNSPSPHHVIQPTETLLSQSLHLENNDACARTLTKGFQSTSMSIKMPSSGTPGYLITLETCNRYFRHVLKATSRLTVGFGRKGCGSKKMLISSASTLNPKRCTVCQGLRKLLSRRLHHICTPRSQAPTSCGLWIFRF